MIKLATENDIVPCVFNGISVIAVVGEKDTESNNANVKVLSALTEAGIEIITMNQGAGKLNLLIGVLEERYKDAIQTIYQVMEG